jgi:GNAT superfamily N-acetyltransferase
MTVRPDALPGRPLQWQVQHGPIAGAIGRVVELHARYYQALAGFGLPFEARVAREMCDFCERFDDRRDAMWLAMDGDVIEAALTIDGLHAAGEGAHLRWFIASGRARGSGVGGVLMRQAMDFCDARGYRRTYLWTFEGLNAARRLYERHGFQLVHQARGTQWGTEVNEQRFERVR